MFTLSDLPYSYNALEPYIDEETMKIHHDKHHAAYVKNLNDALFGKDDFLQMEVDNLLRQISEVPEDIRLKVKNNAGGHANHSLFWQTLRPNPKGIENKPMGELAKAIDRNFGSFEKFKEKMTQTAIGHFGSGWAWVFVPPAEIDKGERTLLFGSMPNQDSPLLIPGTTPILGIDVWEHAYYLKYQNRRNEYLEAFWYVVNWEEVGRRFDVISR